MLMGFSKEAECIELPDCPPGAWAEQAAHEGLFMEPRVWKATHKSCTQANPSLLVL